MLVAVVVQAAIEEMAMVAKEKQLETLWLRAEKTHCCQCSQMDCSA